MDEFVKQYKYMKKSGNLLTISVWELRLRKLGMKKGVFCDTIKISKTAFSRWLNGRVFPTLENFILIETNLERLEGQNENER